jgi:hypothetical protein
MRIDRMVEVSELEYIPFNEQVYPYVNAIGIADGVVIVDTSFRHLCQKPLWDFMSDLEIVGFPAKMTRCCYFIDVRH